MRSSYYDIESILAEEELIPVTNLFEFSHLAHLDPDYIHHRNTSPLASNDEINDTRRREIDGRDRSKRQSLSNNHALHEGTKFKMPLWSIENWGELGFVRIKLPRNFGRKSRERLEADPVSVNLRNISERYFLSGIILVNLVQKCSEKMSRASRKNSRRDAHISEIMSRESVELKLSLLKTYTGARLRRTFDWTLSSIDDDVSLYTCRLTEMELMLFQKGAAASHSHTMWKLYGSRKIIVSETAIRASAMQTSSRLRQINCSPNETGGVTSIVSPENRLGTSQMQKRPRLF
mmetsp:Transcript_10568/g.14907  ORF Transcript_10568/g.14907 Transcript_10568/m.14907 type:complete len:291 (-) Transcript_10568:412-1284(-)